MLDAVDPDQHLGLAQEETGEDDPTAEQIAQAAEELRHGLWLPLTTHACGDAGRHPPAGQQIIDEVSLDQVIEAGYSQEQAGQMVTSFRAVPGGAPGRDNGPANYLQPALRPTAADRHKSRNWPTRIGCRPMPGPPSRCGGPTPSWNRTGARRQRQRVLTDLVSLVRHAVELEDELVPYPELVRQRYEAWLAAQEARGRFHQEQRWWLDRIAETIGVNLGVAGRIFRW